MGEVEAAELNAAPSRRYQLSLVARAQQKLMSMVSYLASTSPRFPYLNNLREGLGEEGYVEGRNLTIDPRMEIEIEVTARRRNGAG
jgi:hypothetical protein